MRHSCTVCVTKPSPRRTLPACLRRLEVQFSLARIGQDLFFRFTDSRGNNYRVTKPANLLGRATIYLDHYAAVAETVNPPNPGSPAIEADLPLRLLNAYAGQFTLTVFQGDNLVPFRALGVGYTSLILDIATDYSNQDTTDYLLTYE